jgi:hypothetical protein
MAIWSKVGAAAFLAAGAIFGGTALLRTGVVTGAAAGMVDLATTVFDGVEIFLAMFLLLKKGRLICPGWTGNPSRPVPESKHLADVSDLFNVCHQFYWNYRPQNGSRALRLTCS